MAARAFLFGARAADGPPIPFAGPSPPFAPPLSGGAFSLPGTAGGGHPPNGAFVFHGALQRVPQVLPSAFESRRFRECAPGLGLFLPARRRRRRVRFRASQETRLAFSLLERSRLRASGVRRARLVAERRRLCERGETLFGDRAFRRRLLRRGGRGRARGGTSDRRVREGRLARRVLRRFLRLFRRNARGGGDERRSAPIANSTRRVFARRAAFACVRVRLERLFGRGETVRVVGVRVGGDHLVRRNLGEVAHHRVTGRVLSHQRVPRPGRQRRELALHAAQLARTLVRLRLRAFRGRRVRRGCRRRRRSTEGAVSRGNARGVRDATVASRDARKASGRRPRETRRDVARRCRRRVDGRASIGLARGGSPRRVEEEKGVHGCPEKSRGRARFENGSRILLPEARRSYRARVPRRRRAKARRVSARNRAWRRARAQRSWTRAARWPAAGAQ